ncbi:ribonuclease H-like domain-containing protein [Tanacetum coccineum]
MVTQSQSSIVKPIDRLSLLTSSLSPISKSPFLAMNDPNWSNVMYDKYNTLVKNGTWVLVPRPSDVNLVRSVWLFKHKFHADGTLSRYMARLVANDSSQKLSVDFDETFSLVVKPATIYTVLILADSRQWPIYQLELRMHFLMIFIWFEAGTVLGFSVLQGSQVAYLLIYVDDIILTASSPDLLQQIIDSLHKEFDMTDLGHLIILGIFVTLVDTETKLGLDGVPIQDPTLYRNLARGLQYLTFTYLDLSYAVQQICLYMHDLREPHFAALKRVLRYVKGTLDPGLHLYASATTSLVSYTDADWAGCPSTRSAEVEYQGVANVVAETAWVYNLLRELHSPLMTATLIKHIEIDIHFVRDMVKAGHVKVLHVPSCFQYADIFTKGLPLTLFEDFHSSLSILIIEYLVNISKRRAFWSLNEDILKINDSEYQYAVSIKEDTAYPCLHSPKTTKKRRSIRRIQRRPIRRIGYMAYEYSRRYQTWSLLQETPIRRIQPIGYAVNLDNSTNNVVILLDSWTSGLLEYKLPLSRAASGLRPYHFTYPERKLTMEEMLYKFIDEGKREHEEMRAFICDFQTTNEVLFKERINSLIELRFGVQELLKVINNTPTIDCEVKGVTTRGGKTTTRDVQNNDTNVHTEEPHASSNTIQTPPIPFPQRLRKEKEEAQQKKFLENLKQLYINLSFIEALAQMPKYAKFLKGLLTNKVRLEEACEPKATRMSLELADRSIQYPRGIIENVLIKVDKFILPIDFVILDMPEDSRVPIILGRPFLATTRAMIDVFNKKITLRVGDDEVIFDIDQSIKRPSTKDDKCYGIDDLDNTINAEAQELLANDEPDSFLSRGLEKSIDQSDLEDCEHVECKTNNDSNEPIRRIVSLNMSYPVVQGTSKPVEIERKHLYSASANEICLTT